MVPWYWLLVALGAGELIGIWAMAMCVAADDKKDKKKNR